MPRLPARHTASAYPLFVYDTSAAIDHSECE